tara:strand:+ start:1869 stop:1982 length:114 start_codon:yes stop_codon:yes gene_type:complete
MIGRPGHTSSPFLKLWMMGQKGLAWFGIGEQVKTPAF